MGVRGWWGGAGPFLVGLLDKIHQLKSEFPIKGKFFFSISTFQILGTHSDRESICCLSFVVLVSFVNNLNLKAHICRRI